MKERQREIANSGYSGSTHIGLPLLSMKHFLASTNLDIIKGIYQTI